MAITDENTVLILGAGVSVPFGLPLGGELIENIAKQLKEELDFWERNSGGYNLQEALNASRYARDYFERPILGSVSYRAFDSRANNFDQSKIRLSVEKLKKLRELLNNQTSETIDDFIVQNPSYAELTKICIAVEFIKSCYEYNDKNNVINLKPFSRREINKERNWVHLLINIIRQGISNKQVPPHKQVTLKNKIQIITFNYDKVLEYVLELQFNNSEKMAEKKFTDYVDILHAHGECGELSEKLMEPASICLQWAQGIHVVNDKHVPENITKVRAQAENIVRSAKELYFCGFSFSAPNCRLLGLDDPSEHLSERVIYFCNYDGNVGVSKALKKYENLVYPTTRNEIVFDGPPYTEIIEEKPELGESKLSAVNWMKIGSLGEPPA